MNKKLSILFILVAIGSFSQEFSTPSSLEIGEIKKVEVYENNLSEKPNEIKATSENAVVIEMKNNINTSQEAIILEPPPKTIYDIAREKKYLEAYANLDYVVEAIYNEKNEIKSIKFSKGNFYLNYDFYSFVEDKIWKITKWDKYTLEIQEFDEKNNLRKLDKVSKGQRIIEEFDLNKKLLRKEVEIKNDKSYEIYFSDGKIKEKGQYKLINGIYEKDGIWEEYYENGKLKNSYIFDINSYYQINYLNDEKNNKNYEGTSIYEDGNWIKDGLWTFYDKGKLSYRGEFSKDKGKFYNYYDEDSTIVSIETSVVLLNDNWVWQGQKIFYGNTGKILEKQFKEGNVLSITGYYENEKNSIRYKGERDLTKTNFEKIGTWIYFSENEKIEEVIEYKDNEAKIKEYIDFENNKLKFSGIIVKNGEYYSWSGLQSYYDKNGNKEMEVIYEPNGYGKIKYFYDNGKLFKEGEVFSQFIQNPSYHIGVLKEYDKNGKIKAIYNYDNGLLDGETLYYDANEKLSVKKIYSKGELIKIENIK